MGYIIKNSNLGYGLKSVNQFHTAPTTLLETGYELGLEYTLDAFIAFHAYNPFLAEFFRPMNVVFRGEGLGLLTDNIGTVLFRYRDSGGIDMNVYSNINIQLNKIYHICGVLRGVNLADFELYINAVDVSINRIGSPTILSNQNVTGSGNKQIEIGRGTQNFTIFNARYFKGIAASQEQINELYQTNTVPLSMQSFLRIDYDFNKRPYVNATGDMFFKNKSVTDDLEVASTLSQMGYETVAPYIPNPMSTTRWFHHTDTINPITDFTGYDN